AGPTTPCRWESSWAPVASPPSASTSAGPAASSVGATRLEPAIANLFASRRSSERERQGLIARRDPLPLGPQLQVGDAAEVAAVAGDAESTERRMQPLVDRLVVDLNHARMQPFADPRRPRP